MRLFHFSDDPAIDHFVPRPVRVPSARPAGMDWLNGPLVWAIAEPWQGLYLFPRECPRILLAPLATTTPADRQRWLQDSPATMVAHIEAAWLERLQGAQLVRYELPAQHFDDLHDAGMWVARAAMVPLRAEVLTDLPAALAAAGVELRVMQNLTPLRDVWSSTLHASGIRLRNAVGW